MNAVDALLEELRDRVRSSRYSQKRIAEHLGCSEKHLSLFMHGRTDPSLAFLRRLSDALEAPDAPREQAQTWGRRGRSRAGKQREK